MGTQLFKLQETSDNQLTPCLSHKQDINGSIVARDSSSLSGKDWGTAHITVECKDQQGLSWSYFWERQVFLTPTCCWGCNYIPCFSAADWPRNRNNRPLFQDLCDEDMAVSQKICCKLIFSWCILDFMGMENRVAPLPLQQLFSPWKFMFFFGLLFLKQYNPHVFRLPLTPYFPYPW